MPTLEHNAIVEMFRERPDLAPHFLAMLFHVDVPRHASVAVVESSLDQLIPVEFRADLVLEVRDAEDAVVLAIVLEVQRDEDPDKEYSWPTYVAVVRARKRCRTVLFVVAPDASVARWAARPIDLGFGLSAVQPVVLGPENVPAITAPAEAEKEKELAVLSAVAHGNGPNGLAVIQTAIVALSRLDDEHAAVYYQVIWNGLREPMRRALERLAMDVQETENDPRFNAFLKNVFALHRKLDAARAAAEAAEAAAEEEGMARGKLLGLRDVLLRLTARAGIALREEDRARIETCDDVATLERWIENVLGAKTAADVLS